MSCSFCYNPLTEGEEYYLERTVFCSRDCRENYVRGNCCLTCFCGKSGEMTPSVLYVDIDQFNIGLWCSVECFDKHACGICYGDTHHNHIGCFVYAVNEESRTPMLPCERRDLCNAFEATCSLQTRRAIVSKYLYQGSMGGSVISCQTCGSKDIWPQHNKAGYYFCSDECRDALICQECDNQAYYRKGHPYGRGVTVEHGSLRLRFHKYKTGKVWCTTCRPKRSYYEV